MVRDARGRNATTRPADAPRPGLVTLAAALTIALLSSAPSLAQRGNGNGNGNAAPVAPASMKLKLPNRLDLEPIRLSELVPGGATVVVFDGSDPVPSLHNPSILREAPDLWRMNLHGQGATAPALLVSYDLTAANGLDGHLSSTSTPSASIRVTLDEIPPSFRINANLVQVEGGVRFHLDVSAATIAGDYAGTLLVTVNTL